MSIKAYLLLCIDLKTIIIRAMNNYPANGNNNLNSQYGQTN